MTLRHDACRDYLKSQHLTKAQGGDFGQAMVALCLAAVKGQSKQWAVVEDKAGAETGALGHNCLTPLVKELMDRGLAWHRAHPGAKPAVVFRRVTSGTRETSCGRPDNEAARKATEEPTSEPTDEPSVTEEPTEESSPTPDPADESSTETTEPAG